ncbi:MAG: hypothetical protein AUJ92_16260 [Armatimonadetes bacterium CG2_30_59_28]|nr:MAG: hypothetical protein AUJ92_16260 [Armatimonadetes bacterium CG2_30_59_28]
MLFSGGKGFLALRDACPMVGRQIRLHPCRLRQGAEKDFSPYGRRGFAQNLIRQATAQPGQSPETRMPWIVRMNVARCGRIDRQGASAIFRKLLVPFPPKNVDWNPPGFIPGVR